jgi:hypothetical protein
VTRCGFLLFWLYGIADHFYYWAFYVPRILPGLCLYCRDQFTQLSLQIITTNPVEHYSNRQLFLGQQASALLSMSLSGVGSAPITDDALPAPVSVQSPPPVFRMPTAAQCEAEFRSNCMRFSGLNEEQQAEYWVLFMCYTV